MTPTIACSEKWMEFGKTFHRLSAAKQQTVWDHLEPDDRVQAQKLLGIVPPQLPGIKEAVADMAAVKESHRSGNFFGFVMVVSLCVMVVGGGYFLLPMIEAPGSQSQAGGARGPSTSERIDEVLDQAFETMTSLVADFGWEATDTVSGVAWGDCFRRTAGSRLEPVVLYRPA